MVYCFYLDSILFFILINLFPSRPERAEASFYSFYFILFILLHTIHSTSFYFMKTKYTAAMRQTNAAAWFQCKLSPWKSRLAMMAKTMSDTHS